MEKETNRRKDPALISGAVTIEPGNQPPKELIDKEDFRAKEARKG